MSHCDNIPNLSTGIPKSEPALRQSALDALVHYAIVMDDEESKIFHENEKNIKQISATRNGSDASIQESNTRRYFTRAVGSTTDTRYLLPNIPRNKERYEMDYDEYSYDYSEDDGFVEKSINFRYFPHNPASHRRERSRTRKAAIPWTQAESRTLSQLVSLHGASEWKTISNTLHSKHHIYRTPSQCSQRWYRVIHPSIDKGPWTENEDELLMKKYDELHGSWCKMSKFFSRTDTQLRRRFEKLSQQRIIDTGY